MISFWEQQSCFEADVVVIGAGIIGLSTAIELREMHPETRVIVLERGLFGEGASTKNAGFACFGSMSEIAADIRHYGLDVALSVVERRWHGLTLLRGRLGDDAMEYEQLGGYELFFENTGWSDKDDVNRALYPIFGQQVFSPAQDKLREFGFTSDKVTGLLFNPLEGQIHSGKMMLALRKKAMETGVEILTGVRVTAIEERPGHVRISGDIANEEVQFRSSTTAVCTNAFLPELLPDLKITPGRGQVLVTSPIVGLPFCGAFHFDEGYYYFRNAGNRILFGGGRNLDFQTESTVDFGLTETVQTSLESLLRNIIAPELELRIDHRWSGIMGFSHDKQPTVRLISSRVAIGFGCNGMGVALGSIIGRDVAVLLDSSS